MMRKVFVLLMVLLATTGIVLAEDITDKLTVQATVSGETRIAFTSNDLEGNVGDFTKFTDNENDKWESDPTYSDIVIYASAITNQRGALDLTLKGTALTRLTAKDGGIASDDSAASASLTVAIDDGKNSSITFNTPASAADVIPSDEDGITFTVINAGAKCSICFRNVTVNWNYDVNFTENENQRQGVPFGSLELSDTNKITIQGVRVNNNSDVAFALYDFYVTNSRSEGGLTNNLFISDYQNCDPLSENHPMGQGISSSSNNVIWKGGALLRFANYANTTLDKYYSGLRILAGDYSLRQWTGSKWVDATGADA